MGGYTYVVCVRCPINGRIHADITYVYIFACSTTILLYFHVIAVVYRCSTYLQDFRVEKQTSYYYSSRNESNPVGKRYRRVQVYIGKLIIPRSYLSEYTTYNTYIYIYIFHENLYVNFFVYPIGPGLRTKIELFTPARDKNDAGFVQKRLKCKRFLFGHDITHFTRPIDTDSNSIANPRPLGVLL